MTAKAIWEALLTELSKVNAPSMLLQDFNYFFNKAINQYINKRYNIYDVNQQTTDDLRVLKATAILDVKLGTDSEPLAALSQLGAGRSKMFGASYEVDLPPDYLHMLNCICIYKVNKDWKCYDAGDDVLFAAKRLTADSWSVIVNDYYNRPLPERPYYYIHNININQTLPTNPLLENNPYGTDNFEKFGKPATVNSLHTLFEIWVETYSNIIDDLAVYSDPTKVLLSFSFNYNNFVSGASPATQRILIDNEHRGLLLHNFFVEMESEYNNASDVETKELILKRIEEKMPLYKAYVKLIKALDNNKYIKWGTKSSTYDSFGNVLVPSHEHITNIDARFIPILLENWNKEITDDSDASSNLPRTIQLKLGRNSRIISTVDSERDTASRYGNPSKVRMEIRYGHDNQIFELKKVFIDYIKTPQYIRLTQEQVNLTEDISQIMEFPDYVCQEIINELVTLVMENTADPRTGSHVQVSQSIALPAQQLTQPQPQAAAPQRRAAAQ